MSSAHYKKTVDDYLRLMSASDWQSVAALYADDATVEDPVGSTPACGIAAVTEFYRKLTTNAMQLELTGPLRIAGVEVAFPLVVTLNFRGQATQIHVIDVFKFNSDGKIVSLRAYFGEENFIPIT
ncbi:MAG TPA: nuclear transport factor 2 family protein [Spongiibacteraceae bacterium]